MSRVARPDQIQAAVVSDRGLSNKRPLNEDSYLLVEERGLFVVADGVGGAQAGDVASRTATEVIGEAFELRTEGYDTEDLLEIAIQRANAAIHAMARADAQLTTMATTVVALHLAGDRATIGHVGDSRLYRLTPDGALHRETVDHSMVEEEIQAGRMTPEQAAHHPGRNVISRALGAEEFVEVDLKTIEVESGSRFLLCSDGVTRHVADGELRELLSDVESPALVCERLKDICYERGAEDNLTAVVVQLGPPPAPENFTVRADDQQTEFEDEEQTISLMARPLGEQPQRPTTPADAGASKRPFSKVVVTSPDKGRRAAGDDNGRAGSNSYRAWPALLLLALPLAFYGGMLFEKNKAVATPAAATAAQTPAAADVASSDAAEAKYERLRREVDRAPARLAERLRAEAGDAPLDSADPELIYLYGRALLLSGRHREAAEAFRRTVARLEQDSAAGARDPLRVEARLSAAAAALKTGTRDALVVAEKELDEVLETAQQR